MNAWNSTLKPGGKLRPRSPKREREDREFAKVKADVLKRDGWLCAVKTAATLDDYHVTPMDVHHVVPRSRDKSLALEPSNLITLCRRHHDWVHDHPVESAALGLLRSTHEHTS